MVRNVVKVKNAIGGTRRLLILSSPLEILKNTDAHMWCFHGTSLSTAYKVLEWDSLCAGDATDSGRTGVFFIGPNEINSLVSLELGFLLARNRAKRPLCTEWIQFGGPSAWSMPVVLMFQHPKDDVTRLKCYKVGAAAKWMIKRTPGTHLPRTSSTRLLLDIEEYHAWVFLHYYANTVPGRPFELKDGQNYDIVMCGGRINDPLYWSWDNVNCDASCGRFCRVCDLEQCGWKHAKNARVVDRIYRCPKCHY